MSVGTLTVHCKNTDSCLLNVMQEFSRTIEESHTICCTDDTIFIKFADAIPNITTYESLFAKHASLFAFTLYNHTDNIAHVGIFSSMYDKIKFENTFIAKSFETVQQKVAKYYGLLIRV